jgi:hypothetical protein
MDPVENGTPGTVMLHEQVNMPVVAIERVIPGTIFPKALQNVIMNEPEKTLSEKESLALITSMINKAKESYHDTGWGPIMWGSVVIICSLVTWAQVVFKFEIGFNIWLLTLAAIIPQIIISYRENKAKRAKTYNDIAMDYTWISFGISMFLLMFATGAMHSGMNKTFTASGTGFDSPSQFLYNYQTALFLILYGFPTFITGGILKFKPMLLGGVFCWVCSITSLYTPALVDLLLLAASALFAWLVPGIIINHNCRKKRRAQNV